MVYWVSVANHLCLGSCTNKWCWLRAGTSVSTLLLSQHANHGATCTYAGELPLCFLSVGACLVWTAVVPGRGWLRGGDTQPGCEGSESAARVTVGGRVRRRGGGKVGGTRPAPPDSATRPRLWTVSYICLFSGVRWRYFKKITNFDEMLTAQVGFPQSPGRSIPSLLWTDFFFFSPWRQEIIFLFHQWWPRCSAWQDYRA